MPGYNFFTIVYQIQIPNIFENMEETIVVSAISRENNVEIVSSVDLLPDLKILFMYEFNV